MEINGSDTNYYNLVDSITSDTTYNLYIEDQYAYFRIVSITLEYIPRNFSETSENDNLVFASVVRYGKYELASLTSSEIANIPGNQQVNSGRPRTRVYHNNDKSFYRTSSTYGQNSFFPIAILYLQSIFAPRDRDWETKLTC